MKIWRFISALCIFSILLNYNYSVKSYDESNDDNITKNNLEYKSIDDLLRELKEERKIINQQKLDEINQKKLEKENENLESKEKEKIVVPEETKPKKSTDNEYIPKLIVRLRGKHSTKYLCSYNLTISDENKEVELSKEIISNYSVLMKKPSLKVRPGETINFEFVPECKSLKAYIWNEESDSLNEINVKRGCMEVPLLDKKIVIIVIGNFSNGYIKYGIVLDIRK